MTPSLYIGLMSGTSMDGVDGVLADFTTSAPRMVLSHAHQPFAPGLRDALFALNQSGSDELHRAALAANALSVAYAEVVKALVQQAGVLPSHIAALGAHGQTIRHQPGLHDGIGYTTQLLNGAVLAELTGIDVVCDFRSRDVAAGGQGAPLVPAFHRAMFAQAERDLAVLNIGGIANLTFLYADGRTGGHDCGPGNVLMDLWCQEHTSHAYDANGRWAAQGQPIQALLHSLLTEPFLRLPPPKSTGRDLFHRAWLETHLKLDRGRPHHWAPVDIQATLTRYTARSAAQDLSRWMPTARQLLVCGGGAMNDQLMRDLADELPSVEVSAIQHKTPIDPMHVEALAFAWLAQKHLQRQAANCTDVTGAAGPRLLGALYPA